MAKVLVNGDVESFADTPGTLGQLFEELDRRCGARGEVLTAVRCDGQDHPSFRDDWMTERPLRDVELVEVEATRPRELLLSVLDDAAAALEGLQYAARRLGSGFRSANLSDASRELVEFAHSLRSLVTLTNAVAAAVNFDIGRGGADPVEAARPIDELSRHIAALIDAQRDQDWISVADTLEYEIGSSLARWPVILTALRQSIPNA